jgi:hypothetical protein
LASGGNLSDVEDLGEALLDFGQMSDLIGWLDADQIEAIVIKA